MDVTPSALAIDNLYITDVNSYLILVVIVMLAVILGCFCCMFFVKRF